jgi:hypothetical protein
LEKTARGGKGRKMAAAPHCLEADVARTLGRLRNSRKYKPGVNEANTSPLRCSYEMHASVVLHLEDAKGQTHPNSKWGPTKGGDSGAIIASIWCVG